MRTCISLILLPLLLSLGCRSKTKFQLLEEAGHAQYSGKEYAYLNAIALYREAIQAESGDDAFDAAAYLKIADLYYFNKDSRAALQAYLQALRLDSTYNRNFEVIYQIAAGYDKTGSTEQAREFADRALSLKTDSTRSDNLLTLSILYRIKGDDLKGRFYDSLFWARKQPPVTVKKKLGYLTIRNDCLAAATISMLLKAERLANAGDEESLREYMLRNYPLTVVLKQGGKVKIIDSESNGHFVLVRPIDDTRSYWLEKNELE